MPRCSPMPSTTSMPRARSASPKLAAEADDSIFRGPAERVAEWRHRWAGLVHWFGAGQHGRGQHGAGQASEAERLQDATITGIANVTALLRRVTEARRGGVSRESQLRHLARWFTSLPADGDAHALFQAVLGLGAPRHVSVGYDDPDLIPGRLSWWEAEPVALARTLVRNGRVQGLSGPGKIQRNDEARDRLRAEQLKATAQRRTAAGQLASDGVYDRVLDEPETQALLTLLDVALTARVPVSRSIGATGPAAGHPLPGRSPPDPATACASRCARLPARPRCARCAAGCTSTGSGWR